MASVVKPAEFLIDTDRIAHLYPKDTVGIIGILDTVDSRLEILLAILATHEENPREGITGAVLDLLDAPTPDECLDGSNSRCDGEVS